MNTNLASAVLLAALCTSAVADDRQPDRSRNRAASVATFPRSVKPALHGKLVALLRGEPPFDDKRVLKLAVTDDWGPWVLSDGVAQQSIYAAVGVYDPQNARCWLWNDVSFYRQRGDAHIRFAYATGRVNEIPCAKLR